MTHRLSDARQYHRCHLQARPEQTVPVHLRRDIRQQSRQNEQLCQDHRKSLRPSERRYAPSAAPLMQLLTQPFCAISP